MRPSAGTEHGGSVQVSRKFPPIQTPVNKFGRLRSRVPLHRIKLNRSILQPVNISVPSMKVEAPVRSQLGQEYAYRVVHCDRNNSVCLGGFTDHAMVNALLRNSVSCFRRLVEKVPSRRPQSFDLEMSHEIHTLWAPIRGASA